MTDSFTCPYCGGPTDRIDVTSFGGKRRAIPGDCAARCIPPSCITCDDDLDPDMRCPDIDCPLYGHRQYQETTS